MSNAFSVDPEVLADSVDAMSDYHRAVQSMLDEIETMVENLHIRWTGQAATAHAAVHREWTSGAQMMREALGRLKSAGTTVHGNYTGAIAANKRMWS